MPPLAVFLVFIFMTDWQPECYTNLAVPTYQNQEELLAKMQSFVTLWTAICLAIHERGIRALWKETKILRAGDVI